MIRTFGRMILLSLIVSSALQTCANAAEENSLGRMPEFQKSLTTPITWELAVDTTLDKALDELLTKNGIPWSVDDAAFGPENKDIVKKTEVDKMKKVEYTTRAIILKKLLDNIAVDSGKTFPAYVLRPDHLEITTHESVKREFYPGRLESHLPELSYSLFDQTPLRQALAEVARTTESTVVLDPKCDPAAVAKVSGQFRGIPADTAVQVLADMAGLKLVRLENVYYVTSPEHANLLGKEVNERRSKQEKAVKQATSGLRAGPVDPLADGDYSPPDVRIIP